MNILKARAGAVVTYHNSKVFDRIGKIGNNLTTDTYINGKYIKTQWENDIVQAVEYVGHLLTKEELQCLNSEGTFCAEVRECKCLNCKKYIRMKKLEDCD